MSRAALGLAAIAAAAVLLLSLRYSPEPPSPPKVDRGLSTAPVPAAAPAAPAVAGTGAPRAGFPTMGGAVEDRSWEALITREIEVVARQRGGDGWDEDSRARLVGALRRLRDAGARRDRNASDPDSDDAIVAAARQREAALEADALSRELFGVPLAVFLQQADPSGIEEVRPP